MVDYQAKGTNKMLRDRLIYGFIGVCLLVLVLYIGGWLFKLSVLLLALLASSEMYKAFQKKGEKPLKFTGLAIVTLFYVQHYYFTYKNPTNTISIDLSRDFLYIILATLLVSTVALLAKDRGPKDAIVTIYATLYPGILFIFAYLLGSANHLYNNQTLPSNFLLIIVLLSTFSTDTFAYFVGRALGMKKLCPDISPNKTVAGSVGGLVGSMLITLVAGIVLSRHFQLEIHSSHFIAIGLLCGILSQAGDLNASLIKRYCNIKDFGNILPGHGGVMDRCDSLLFTMPLGYIYYIIFLL